MTEKIEDGVILDEEAIKIDVINDVVRSIKRVEGDVDVDVKRKRTSVPFIKYKENEVVIEMNFSDGPKVTWKFVGDNVRRSLESTFLDPSTSAERGEGHTRTSPTDPVIENGGHRDWERDVEEIERAVDRASGTEGRKLGPDEQYGVVDKYEDGSIRFFPRFTREQAGFVEGGSGAGHEDGRTCADCAHYIDGGGCHLVQGEVQQWDYCEEFYADVGVFAREDGGEVETTMWLWGEKFDWSLKQAGKFSAAIAKKIEERIGKD